MPKKVCKECGESKDISTFNKDKKMKDGHINKCNVCVNERRRKRESEIIEEVRAKNKIRDIKRRNNLERKEYLKSYNRIEKTCVNCNESFDCYRRSNKTVCDSCLNKIKEENKQTKKEIKQLANNLFKELKQLKKSQQKLIDKQEKIKERTKECSTCGSAFVGASVLSAYCSPKCRNKAENRKKEIRKGKRGELILSNGNVDADISLEKLVLRDNNTCYLCGEQCDNDDYIVTDEGHYITGNHYPSIDHVVAIANGGTHTWDNVLLAHRICNSIKSDKVIV